MSRRVIAIAGGGAAGFFAAITCAESAPEARIVLLERGPQFLAKVKISGGGRCNVTHAWKTSMNPANYYPRGHAALRGAFHRFGFGDTVAWYEARGVKLKAEPDGRIFPMTDSSQTIIDCLLEAAQQARVDLLLGRGLKEATFTSGTFRLIFDDGEKLLADRLLLCTGGCRSVSAGQLAVSLGHTLVSPVPSLFAFSIAEGWIRELPGLSVQAELTLKGMGVRERGPVLLTHTGLSGPAVLRASAWTARPLHAANYSAPLLINWVPHETEASLRGDLEENRRAHAAALVRSTPLSALPARLWERLVEQAGVSGQTRWAGLGRAGQHRLVQQLLRTELHICGKSLNKEEFVTCGGIDLDEVDFKRMESRICPGLHLAGELLDIDAVTGGFNFQAAWTTGWLAGKAMAEAL